MRPLRYSINVTFDGCCDHREMIADEDLHRHAMEYFLEADALLLGGVTYEMMEAAWRLATRTVAMPDWTEPFAGWPRANAVRGAIEACRLTAREPAGVWLGAVAMRYEPSMTPSMSARSAQRYSHTFWRRCSQPL